MSQSNLGDTVQRVTLNRQTSNRECIKADEPQGSNLGSLFFVIYVNDLATNVKFNVNLFVDDTSLFSIVPGALKTANNILNKDLRKIGERAKNGKWLLIRTQQNKLKKSFFQKKKKKVINHFIPISTLINLWLKKCKPKS